MTYELAKKLKDAGFPFKKCSFPDYPSGCSAELFYEYHFPTLSELIEACGAPFGLVYSHSGKLWSAYTNKQKKGIWLGKDDTGNTPEEAVANLWLELNKKNG